MHSISTSFPLPSNPLDKSGWVLRSGIIPYAINDGKIYLLLGVKNNGKWTDFGGGCRQSKKETPFQCALRELKEESLDSVHILRSNIHHICVTGQTRPHQVILFVNIGWDPTLPILFKQQQSDRIKKNTLYKKHKEIHSIHWVPLSMMCALSRHHCDDSLRSIRPTFSKTKSIVW